jgi:hypothetical protein
MWQEHTDLQKGYPVIQQMIESDGAITLSADEHKAYIRYLDLKYCMENMERKLIYFCGHTDNYAYLKKIGVI